MDKRRSGGGVGRRARRRMEDQKEGVRHDRGLYVHGDAEYRHIPHAYEQQHRHSRRRGGDRPRAPGPSAQGGKHRVPLKAVGESVHAEKRQGGVRRVERHQEKGPGPVPHGEGGGRAHVDPASTGSVLVGSSLQGALMKSPTGG